MRRKLVPIAALALVTAGCDGMNDGGGSVTPPADVASEGLATFDFEGATPGAPPAGFTVAETASAGTPGTWTVAEDGGGRIVKLAETANRGQTYNLLLSERDFPADVTVRVRVRADAGAEDQGGGVLWRAKGPDDYLIARWNPLEDNVRYYRVAGGQRKLLKSADVHVDPRAWHDLEVRMRADRATVLFDGQELFTGTDALVTGPGRIGLWTKADAATSFDDLRVLRVDAD